MSEPSLSSSPSVPPYSKHRVVRKHVVVKRPAGSTLHSSIQLPRWVSTRTILYLLLVMVASLILATSTLCHFHDKLLRPYMLQHRWSSDESVVVNDVAFCEDVTASRSPDLLVPSSTVSTDDSFSTIRRDEGLLRHMKHHGMGIFLNVLSPETAQILRDHVLEKNNHIHVIENIPVIQFENRWSVGLETSHPAVRQALLEITRSSSLTAALEGLLGPNPAIVELSTITSTYGAQAQHFHADTDFSASALLSSGIHTHFAPLYTILIPLQDTKPSQGATWVCPGTQHCRRNVNNICDDLGFAVSTSANDGTQEWKAGDALVYSSAMQHRGGAHHGGPDRVALLVSVASRPEFAHQLPLGPVYGIRWDHWGSCWKDWSNENTARQASVPLIRFLRALGLIQFPGSHRGWTFVESAISRMMNDMYYFRLIDLESLVHGRIGLLGKLPWFLQGRVETADDYAPWPLYLADICRNIRNTVFVSMVFLVSLHMYVFKEVSDQRQMVLLLGTLVSLSILSRVIISFQEPMEVDWNAFDSDTRSLNRHETDEL